MSFSLDQYVDVVIKVLDNHIMAPETIYDNIQRDSTDLNFSDLKLILDEMKGNKIVLQLPDGDYILQSNLDRINAQDESLRAKLPTRSLSRGSHEFGDPIRSSSQSRSKSPRRSTCKSSIKSKYTSKISSTPSKRQTTSRNKKRLTSTEVIADFMPDIYRALVRKVLEDNIRHAKEILNLSYINQTVIPINLSVFKQVLNEMTSRGEIIKLPGGNYMLQNILDEINEKRKSLAEKRQRSSSSRMLDVSVSSCQSRKSTSTKCLSKPRCQRKSKSQLSLKVQTPSDTQGSLVITADKKKKSKKRGKACPLICTKIHGHLSEKTT